MSDVQVLNSGAGRVLTLGVPLSLQPRVRVVDAQGQPLPNRTVVVYSSGVPNIYRADMDPISSFLGAAFHTHRASPTVFPR